MVSVPGRVGVVVAAALLACGQSSIVFESPASGTIGASTSTAASSVGAGGSVVAGVGGSVIASGGGGAGGGSAGSGGAMFDASAGDAGSIACTAGAMPAHAVDAFADALAVTPTHLYWLDSTLAVMRQTKATGALEKLTIMDSRGARIRTDAARVYWDEFDADNYWSVFSMPLDGSAAHVRLATRVSAWALGVDRVFYWTPRSSGDGGSIGEIDSVPKTGGLATVVVADALATGPMAADATGLYWYDGRTDAGMSFEKLTFATSARTEFKPATSIRYLLADGTRVVWVDESDYLGPARVQWSSPSGDLGPVIATGQIDLLGLAADATTAYWLTGGPLAALGPADLTAGSFDGGPLRKLACNIDSPLDLAVDDESVYVASGRSIVWKVAKNAP
jgi:hypothetical protein